MTVLDSRRTQRGDGFRDFEIAELSKVRKVRPRPVLGRVPIYTYIYIHLDPQCTSIEDCMVSIRWYLGCLEGYLGGAGTGSK